MRSLTSPRPWLVTLPVAAVLLAFAIVLISGSFLLGRAQGVGAIDPVPASGAAPVTGFSQAPPDALLTAALPGRGAKTLGARDLYNYAEELHTSGRCDRAMPYFNAAIARNPSYVNALRARARCAQALGADDIAIADLTTALRADPRNYGLLLNRADAETDNGSNGRAQIDALAALRLVPAQAPAYDSIAQSLYNVADLADAAATINLAVQVLPSDPAQYALRGKYKAAMFDYTGAKADYSRAIGLSAPNDQPDLYRRLADVQDQAQDYSAARRSIAIAIARRPHDPALYLDAAAIEGDAGNPSGVLRRDTQALAQGARGNQALQAQESRGDALASLHRKGAALHAYRQALLLTRDGVRRAGIRAKITALGR